MSARVEKLISEYPQMVSQKKCLAYQVAHFRGLSPEDVITSMYTAHHEGERVQTSGTSDKTAQIALNYDIARGVDSGGAGDQGITNERPSVSSASLKR